MCQKNHMLETSPFQSFFKISEFLNFRFLWSLLRQPGGVEDVGERRFDPEKTFTPAITSIVLGQARKDRLDGGGFGQSLKGVDSTLEERSPTR